MGSGTGGNVAIGLAALLNATSCIENVAIGTNVATNVNGNANVIIGNGAGGNLTSGSNNIIIGFNAQPSSAAVGNEIILGTATETLKVQGGFNYRVDAIINSINLSSAVLAQFYVVDNVAVPITITLPAPAAGGTTYVGAVVNFKRYILSAGNITFNVDNGGFIIPYNSIANLSSITLSSTQYSTTFICDGTYWYQMQQA